MTGLHQVTIGGYPSGGLTQDRKPAFLPNEAFSDLENAYVFRERTKKRDGEVPMGRLRRVFANLSLGNSDPSVWAFTIWTTLVPPIVPEPNAEIEPGSVRINIGPSPVTGMIVTYSRKPNCVVTSIAHGLSTGDVITISGATVVPGTGDNLINGGPYTITVGGPDTFALNVDSSSWGQYAGGGTWTKENTTGQILIDQGDGTLATNPPSSTVGTINYMTGAVTITNGAASAATIINFNYFPGLPAMGILKRDVSVFGIDQTVFFDTKYAYQYNAGFEELVPGFVWSGTNTDFFWAANYQGATPNLRYFFVTNNNIDSSATSFDPIRYYNSSTWTDLQPLITVTDTLFQALIVIPYYGRLLALNTWEGPTAGTYLTASNFFSRCRFSQIGDPTDQTNGWRADIFGRGGFIDAPTNEAIVSAAFFRNTLIVFFEYSTWQLRYIGEYGLPFIFERISSDFGAVSPYSPIVFDQGVMAVSDRGIIESSAAGVKRLDDQIPEQVFSFQIQNSAPNFVHGVRDFEKELVYWNYVDTQDAEITQNFPNKVLLFNYRNNTWAKFRDTITCFGTTQFQFGVTWDSFTTFWDSNVSWDTVDDQQYVDYVACGTQQGFINIYNNPDASTPEPVHSLYAQSMAITAVDFTKNPNQITIPNHNLANNEIIYITGTLWDGADPGLNNMIYNITVVDVDTITLSIWDQESQSYDAVNITSSSIYIGGGRVALFPKMNIVGKDFNPFQSQGKQFKLAFIDFQMDSNLFSPAIAATTIQLFVNSYLGEQANLIATNQELINSSQGCGFITRATKSNPCQITSLDHSLTTGTLIYIANVQGMTQLNSVIYSITVVDHNTFTLDNTNSTGFGTYIKGGIWNTSPVNGQTYISGSQYAWYRFYSTQFGQYLRIGMTYDDSLMNQLATHQTPMELNAMNIWFREGGRLIN